LETYAYRSIDNPFDAAQGGRIVQPTGNANPTSPVGLLITEFSFYFVIFDPRWEAGIFVVTR
jgi:hypothetical protein